MDIRKHPWLFGGILTLAGVGVVYALHKSSSGCQIRIKAGDRIMLIGDSLAVGLTSPVKALATQSGCDFFALAKSGTMMPYWTGNESVAGAIQTFSPTLILVSLGTNDSKGNHTDEQLAAHVAALREFLSVTGAAIVWILPPQLPFPERVSKHVLAAGIASFPSSTLPIPQGDGIHPTARGYAGWAEHIFAYLSCSAAPQQALASLGAAPIVPPTVPPFMRPAKAPGSKAALAIKRRRRI